jgi:hypothetical protein
MGGRNSLQITSKYNSNVKLTTYQKNVKLTRKSGLGRFEKYQNHPRWNFSEAFFSHLNSKYICILNISTREHNGEVQFAI